MTGPRSNTNSNTSAVTVIKGPEGGRTCRAQLVNYDMSVLHISRTHAPRGAASTLFSPAASPRPTRYPLPPLRALRALQRFESGGIEMKAW